MPHISTLKTRCLKAIDVLKIRADTEWGAVFLIIGVLGFNASATARVISRQLNDDDDEISYLEEETGVPGENHRPAASN